MVAYQNKCWPPSFFSLYSNVPVIHFKVEVSNLAFLTSSSTQKFPLSLGFPPQLLIFFIILYNLHDLFNMHSLASFKDGPGPIQSAFFSLCWTLRKPLDISLLSTIKTFFLIIGWPFWQSLWCAPLHILSTQEVEAGISEIQTSQVRNKETVN